MGEYYRQRDQETTACIVVVCFIIGAILLGVAAIASRNEKAKGVSHEAHAGGILR